MDLTFGRYLALFPIASGGMAEVYAALQTGEGGFTKAVAVKRMLPHLAPEQHFVDMFLDEARVAVAIESPHVVGTLDLGRADDGAPYLVMDLVVGVSLAELIAGVARRGTTVPLPLAAEILAQAAVGLHDAHEATSPGGEPLHIVHRDVSPQNILIGVDGIVRIGDFGIVQAMNRRTQTSAGQLKGKFVYFAPEQAAGEALDRRTDVFALAIVAWELLAGGRHLFGGEDEAEVLAQVRSRPIPRLTEVRPDIPAALADVVARGLARDRDARFQTALELATALRAAARQIAEAAGASEEPPSRDELEAFVRETCGARIDRLETRLRDAITAATDPGSDLVATVRESKRELDTRVASDPRDRSAERATVPERASGRSWERPPATTAAPRRRRLVIAAALVAGSFAATLAIVIALRTGEGGGAGAGDPEALLARTPPIAARACKEWSRALAFFQQESGGFGLEPQREPWGYTTAQQLFPLIESHVACGHPGVTPLRSGLAALARFDTTYGWTGDGRAETPATAWAILAMTSAARVLGDATQRDAAVAARAKLLLAQRPDGSFRTLPPDAAGPQNGISTVMALWALVALEHAAPDATTTEARRRAAAWVRRALVEDIDEPPLRVTAGLHEHATWVLLRARALPGGDAPDDPALFERAARELVERCGLGADGRCARQIYENGQTYLVRTPGSRPEFMTFWHPWTTLAAHELARAPDLVRDPALRARLAAVAAWGAREIEAAVPSLTAAPGYKLAEYLFVATALLRDHDRASRSMR